MSLKAYYFGNPRAYACWLDEGLNLVLRDIAGGVHKARQDERIFTHMHTLLGNLRPALRIWASKNSMVPSVSFAA